eukprot:5508006-Pleurochrysis_carterae.AAC.1
MEAPAEVWKYLPKYGNTEPKYGNTEPKYGNTGPKYGTTLHGNMAKTKARARQYPVAVAVR